MSDKPLPPRPPLPDRPTADRQRSWTSQREPPAFGQGDDWSSGPSSPALSAFSPAAAWPPSHPASSSSTRLALPPSLLTAASALCRQARLRLTSKVRISSRRLRLARMAGCSSISASPSFCPTSLQVRRLCLQSSRYSASLTSLDLCRLCKRRCRALRREGARAQAWLQQVGRRRPEPLDPDHDRRLPGCVLRSRFISFWLIVDHVAILCASARRRPGETVRPCSALTRQEELTFCFLFAPTLAAIPRSGPCTHCPWPSRPDRHSWRVCRLGPLDRQRPDRVF
jgi:hypothetical protein